MHRFFITADAWDKSKLILEGEQAHQIMRVLRMSPGEHIMVLDNSGWEFEMALEEVKEKLVTGSLVEKRLCNSEPHTRLAMYQSLLKRENFEWVLQKCTEIGVTSFIPTLCERTVRHDNFGKPDRWGKIVREAAEQSGRGKLPILSAPLRLADAFSQATKYDLTFIAWEGEKTLRLRRAVAEIAQPAAPVTLAVFIGPEGGFSAQEIEKAVACGVRPVSLGRLILRSETAAVAAAAIVLHALE